MIINSFKDKSVDPEDKNKPTKWTNYFWINLLLINHSNMFRPLSRSHHQGVQNPWELQSHCIDLLMFLCIMCSRRDVIAVECLAFHSYHIATWTHIHNNILTGSRSIQWLCNSQGFWTPWWWLRLRGRNMLEWLISNELSRINLCISLVYFYLQCCFASVLADFNDQGFSEHCL